METTDAFFAAIKAGSVDKVTTFLRQEPWMADAIHTTGAVDMNALVYSVEEKQPEITKLLVEAGAKIGVFEAAALGDARSVHRHLDQDRSLAEKRCRGGWSLLHLSVFSASLALCADLTTYSGLLNAVSANVYATTPLQLAIARSEVPCVSTLLAAGADPNVMDPASALAPPLHLATILGLSDAVRDLLHHQADVTMEYGVQMQGRISMHGPDGSVVGPAQSRRAIDLAIQQGHVEIIRMLKDHRA